MALVKRKVKGGAVTVLGRRYVFPEHRRVEAEGKEVFVDDDGVCRVDVPKWGIRTDSNVRVFYPRRYDWFTNATLDEP